jgi:hypothetical protein
MVKKQEYKRIKKQYNLNESMKGVLSGKSSI